MEVYFKSGKGIVKPLDFNGNEIKIGNVLTSDVFDDFFNDSFYEKHFPLMTKEDIQLHKNKPMYIVKWNAKGFFYAEGVHQKLYLHDFRFKHTKIIKK